MGRVKVVDLRDRWLVAWAIAQSPKELAVPQLDLNLNLQPSGPVLRERFNPSPRERLQPSTAQRRAVLEGFAPARWDDAPAVAPPVVVDDPLVEIRLVGKRTAVEQLRADAEVHADWAEVKIIG